MDPPCPDQRTQQYCAAMRKGKAAAHRFLWSLFADHCTNNDTDHGGKAAFKTL
jgi:hypothetical protein